MPLSRQDSFQIKQATAEAARYETTGDFREASHHLNEIAMLYWKHSYYEEAITYYVQSLSFNQRVNNENGAAMINSNLGMLYADVSDYNQALVHFERTLTARRASGERIGQISALHNLGVVLNRLARYDEAVARLEEALKLAKELSSVPEIRSCYGMLAETYANAGNADKSLHYFNLYRSFHELAQRDLEQASEQSVRESELRARVAEQNDQIQQMELRRAFEARDSAQAASLMADSANLGLHGDLRRKDLALAYLQERQALASKEQQLAAYQVDYLKLELSRERWRLSMIVVALIGLTVGAILLYRGRRAAVRQNRLLREQQAEIQAQAAQIAHMNECLEQQVAERTAELEERNEQLIKHAFLNSHRLRAPLARLLGLTQLLSLIGFENEEQHSYTNKINGAAKEIDAVTREINRNLSNEKPA